MKSIEQQAADAMSEQLVNSGPGGASCRAAANMLASAGLLVSERDQLCRKLADAYIAWRMGGDRDIKACSDAANDIQLYDREHAPKPRYYVEAFTGGHPDTHRVRDRSRGNVGDVRGFGTESECIAIMNALAEKEGGR